MNDASAAALITNTWADLFVKRANFVFGNQGEDALAFFETQLKTAEIKLETAEMSFIDFQSTNRQITLRNELDVLSQTQVNYQHDLREIRAILEEARFLQGQLSINGDNLTPADAVAGLILQSKALNIDSGGNSSSETLQLQLTADTLSTTLDGQAALLGNLEQLLLTKKETLEEELVLIDQDMLERQTALQKIFATRTRLETDRDVAAETYDSLSRKVEESRISSQETASQVQLASKAAAPLEPAGISPLIQSILAAMVMFLGTIGVSFLSQWWSHGRPASSRK
jgi:uncharacterized protein involved in exopolysaccharide biosynthesis